MDDAFHLVHLLALRTALAKIPTTYDCTKGDEEQAAQYLAWFQAEICNLLEVHMRTPAGELLEASVVQFLKLVRRDFARFDAKARELDEVHDQRDDCDKRKELDDYDVGEAPVDVALQDFAEDLVEQVEATFATFIAESTTTPPYIVQFFAMMADKELKTKFINLPAATGEVVTLWEQLSCNEEEKDQGTQRPKDPVQDSATKPSDDLPEDHAEEGPATLSLSLLSRY